MVIYGICAIFGIIIGTVCVIVFFQSLSLWNKGISAGFGLIGTSISYRLIQKVTGATDVLILQRGFLVLLIALVVAMVITFYLVCKTIKGDDTENIIRVRDILLGQHEYIKDVYRKRAESLHHESLFKKEQADIAAEREELRRREQEIKNREDMLNEQQKNAVGLTLPVDSFIPVTNELLGKFPNYTEGLSKFMYDLQQLTDDYCNYREFDSKKGKFDVVYSYFLAICSFAMEDLFDTSSKNVRIHFRYLGGDEYVKLVAKEGKFIYEDELTPMPKNQSLINSSFINKASLIKSLNTGPQYYKGNNRNVWEDFMTIAFYGICKDDVPFISMGISVRNKERFKHLLYFLNFCKIENFLQENLMRFNKCYNIIDTIENNRKDGVEDSEN